MAVDDVNAGDYTPPMGELERQARRNPGGLRLDDVRRLAEANGFHCRRGRRGHWVCSHTKLTRTVGFAEPHGGERFVKRGYVRELLAAFDEVRRSEAEDDASED